ncbi:MAG TPA: adenylate/guanylate cyclase domain-containing protein [Chitinophagaceae bacterium]|jgi:adenylate cyclase|nr:adenylate/guanylate cyclase domain-containing protein [Chitinophagaceae bacterium]
MGEKYLVEFAEEKVIEVAESQSILDASLSAGIPHFHACGGNAKCSTCRVLIIEGDDLLSPATREESFLRNQMHFPPNVRLACQAHVTGGPVKLRRIIQDETDIGLYVGSAAGDSTQQLGEEKELALMFLDIRNFTHIVENHPAFDVIHIIRKLFSSFQSRIEYYKGQIVETTGDGLYAVFGCEMGREQSAQLAVQAAYSILEDLETLNETYFIPHFEETIEAGIGVHIGKVVSGTVRVGTEDHSVVMGYAVNIASRLQTATRELNNDFIASSEIYTLLNDAPALQSQSIVVKGIANPLTVYLMGKPYKQMNRLPSFNKV